MVLAVESENEFQEMLGFYADTYQPGSPVEKDMVHEMVACRWRMERLRMIETALLDSEMQRVLPEAESPADPGYRMAFAFRRLVDESRAISLLSRYESRLHRIHERSHRTLRELQQIRKEQITQPVTAEPVQPEPPPPTAAPAPAHNPSVSAEALRVANKKLPNEPEPLTPAAARKDRQYLSFVGHRRSWGGRSCRLPRSVAA